MLIIFIDDNNSLATVGFSGTSGVIDNCILQNINGPARVPFYFLFFKYCLSHLSVTFYLATNYVSCCSVVFSGSRCTAISKSFLVLNF